MSKRGNKGASLGKGVNLGLIVTRIFLKTRTRASLGKIIIHILIWNFFVTYA